MSLYDLAFALGMSVTELQALPYEEILGWQAYFQRRPPGWREDARSARQVQARAGSKVKPEELFPSLKLMKEAEAKHRTASNTIAAQLLKRFSHQSSNKAGLEELGITSAKNQF